MDALPRGCEADMEEFWARLRWICLQLIRHRTAPSSSNPWGISIRMEYPPLTGEDHDLSPLVGVVDAVGVAPEGEQLIATGLSTEVVESRAPSMMKLYTLKLRLFTSWCADCQLDPVNCPFVTVLEFLPARFSAGLTHSTMKVYVAAIAAYHAPLGGLSVGKNPLVTRFLFSGQISLW